jgi:hypothetical protein
MLVRGARSTEGAAVCWDFGTLHVALGTEGVGERGAMRRRTVDRFAHGQSISDFTHRGVRLHASEGGAVTG